MDNAASTRLCDAAFNAMIPFLKEDHANPGGIYAYADNAKRAIAKARSDIAGTIGAGANEIYFTGGGTESDNWALKGIAEHALTEVKRQKTALSNDTGPHIITGTIEHHAVLNTCRWLEKNGCRVSYVKPDLKGNYSISEIEKLICKDTILISLMLVNNELGTIQMSGEIGAAAHEHGIPFHTDAVAAYGHIPIDVKAMEIDLLSASGHKFNGPKGIGFLYVDEKYKILPLMHGGSQEQGRRAGTVNVAGIAGMAAAAVSHYDNMMADLEIRRQLDGYFIKKLKERDHLFTLGNKEVRAVLNGPLCNEGTVPERLPGTFSMTIPGIRAEELIVRLGMEGVCVSAGAACAATQDAASHVLKEIGLDGDSAYSTIRISMNEDNTEEEIDILFDLLEKCIKECGL